MAVIDDFEWDDAKSEANLRKHGVSFEVAEALFEDPDLFDGNDARTIGCEVRIRAIGRLDRSRPLGAVRDVLFVCIYTWRGGRRRVISLRRARPEERRGYESRARKS